MRYLVYLRFDGEQQKKAGVAENPEVLGHAGLLIDGPPGIARLPFA
jgi:hypothetical protein